RAGTDFSRIRTIVARSGRGARRSPTPRSAALHRPHFSCLLCHNSDFGRSGRCVPTGRIRFGSPQNPGCGAVRSDAVALRTYETSLTRRQTMQKGTVKWFNPTKGYGFIRPSTGDKDVFVHISAVVRGGVSDLN